MPRIVERFGEKTFEIIENEPERLAEIKRHKHEDGSKVLPNSLMTKGRCVSQSYFFKNMVYL